MTATNPSQDFVLRLRRHMAQKIGRDRFDLWFGESGWRYDDGALVISDSDAQRLGRLKSKLHLELVAASEELLGSAPTIRYERGGSDDARRLTSTGRATHSAQDLEDDRVPKVAKVSAASQPTLAPE
ncbi:MAG TPA: hypothetical protein VIY86_11900, partial [Pirellulaceae bacterium]